MDGQCSQKPQPLVFPSSNKTTPSISRDKARAKARAEKQDANIHEVCEGTSGALQELRHGVIYILFDTLEMIDLNAQTLAIRIAEPIRVVRAIKQRETDRLTTERLIDILEKLRPMLQP
jgi:hypothetical protein